MYVVRVYLNSNTTLCVSIDLKWSRLSSFCLWFMYKTVNSGNWFHMVIGHTHQIIFMRSIHTSICIVLCHLHFFNTYDVRHQCYFHQPLDSFFYVKSLKHERYTEQVTFSSWFLLICIESYEAIVNKHNNWFDEVFWMC